MTVYESKKIRDNLITTLCDELNQSRYESRIKMGGNLYNWQFYIQESKAKERKEEENKRCARGLIYKLIRINIGP
jgi:hypothetical protein